MTQRTSGTGERALRPLCRLYLSPTGVLFEIHTTALCWRRSALCNQLVETWQLGRHEARLGHPDTNWPEWYADYMVKEQTGQELPQ